MDLHTSTISTTYPFIYKYEETTKDHQKCEEKQHDEKKGQDKQAELTSEETDNSKKMLRVY